MLTIFELLTPKEVSPLVLINLLELPKKTLLFQMFVKHLQKLQVLKQWW